MKIGDGVYVIGNHWYSVGAVERWGKEKYAEDPNYFINLAREAETRESTFLKTRLTDKQEMLEKLSADSKAVLQAVKDRGSVTEDEWQSLTKELRDMGAISDSDYKRTNFEVTLVPLGKFTEDGTFILYHSAPTDELEQIDTWPGNPLEKLDLWTLALDKWKEVLMRSSEEDLPDDVFSVLNSQSTACSRVSKAVRDLIELL